MSELPNVTAKSFYYEPGLDHRPAARRSMMRELRELRIADCPRVQQQQPQFLVSWRRLASTAWHLTHVWCCRSTMTWLKLCHWCPPS